MSLSLVYYAHLQAQIRKLSAGSARRLIVPWRIRDNHEYGRPKAPSLQQAAVAQPQIVGISYQYRDMLSEVHMHE